MTDPLVRSGWRLDTRRAGHAGVTFQSSDSLISLHRHISYLRHEAEMDGDAERWLLEVGPPGSHRWYATASSNIPDELLGALTTAVADPAPAFRYLRRAGVERLPDQATATPTAPSPLEVARVQAATARSTPRRPPTSALAYTTATRPTTLPPAALAQRAR